MKKMETPVLTVHEYDGADAYGRNNQAWLCPAFVDTFFEVTCPEKISLQIADRRTADSFKVKLYWSDDELLWSTSNNIKILSGKDMYLPLEKWLTKYPPIARAKGSCRKVVVYVTLYVHE